jgi:hypothetical protein
MAPEVWGADCADGEEACLASAGEIDTPSPIPNTRKGLTKFTASLDMVSLIRFEMPGSLRMVVLAIAILYMQKSWDEANRSIPTDYYDRTGAEKVLTLTLLMFMGILL